MSEISEQPEGEQLFATQEAESNTDSTGDTNRAEETSNGEQESKELKLDEPKQPTNGSAQKEKQIDSFVQAIKDDKKSFDDIPEQWLKDAVKARLNTLTTPVAKTTVKEEVRDAIIEERAEQRYRAMIVELNSLGLSREKREVMQEEFTRFRGLSLSSLDALESSMRIAGVNLENEYIEQRRRGAIASIWSTILRKFIDISRN